MRQRYAAAHPGWRESGQVYEALSRQHVRPNARVLDIGCGRGGVLELLHSQVALAVGVDPDQGSLVEHRVPTLRRAAGLMERLPFSDQSFDLVLCSWVLEHLVDPEQAFAEVARVLRGPASSGGPNAPNAGGGTSVGHFVFLTPNAWHPLTWANRWLGRLGDLQTRLVRRWYGRDEADTFPIVYRANTRRQIEQLACAVGLTPVAFYQVGDPTYLAFNEPLYRLAVLAERLTPRWMKVHLLGHLVKERL